MKKQLYPITKNDWCVSWGKKTNSKKGKFVTYMRFFIKKKDAMEWIKTKNVGYIQLFKINYEFRDSWVRE